MSPYKNDSIIKMLVVLLLLFAVSSEAASRYFISAPNVFHVNAPENVSVLLTGVNTPATVQLYMQDYPHRKKTFSQVQADFSEDTPGYLTVKVTPADLPDQGSLDKQYVYLVATCNHAQLKFKKEMKILLSFRNGIILIQTDKPIYTPKQMVNIRVVPLDFNLFPSSKKLTVIVKNPQGIRVEQWKDLNTDTGFISKSLELGDFILKGNWTIEAYFDGLVIYNTSTVFEVREYVLPKFSVQIKGPDDILPNQKKFRFEVIAKTTYKKDVYGVASVRVKIVSSKQTPFVIASFRQVMRNSFMEFWITKRQIESLNQKIWFPEGRRLHVEVKVTEQSTGITEQAIVNSILFTSSPYRIKFTNTARYFRPGIQFPIKIQVTDTRNKPKPNMPVLITAKGIKKDSSVVDIGQSALLTKDDAANKGRTDNEGYADFLVDVPRDINILKIEAETNLPNIGEYNGVKEYVINKYSSPSGEYLMVRQRKPVQVGQNVICEAFVSSRTVNRLHYMVIARGQIVHQNVYVEKIGVMKTIVFQATAMMSPSARLVAYYVLNNGEVISDTTPLDISDSFPNMIAIKEPDNHAEYPGDNYRVEVLGEKGTLVALLAVDQSVYLLRNENRLTPKSVFEKLDELDLGCGTGSGKDTKDVFKNSGLSVMTGSLVSDGRQDFTCQDPARRRSKRAIGANNTIDCCKLGETIDIKKGNCWRRAFDLDVPAYQFDKKALNQCKNDFFICCGKKFGLKGLGMLGRSAGGDPLDFQSEEEIIDATQVRSFFPETWFIQERTIRDVAAKKDCEKYVKRQFCHAASLETTVPDSITTWIVQAIAVSNTSGFGIAKPMHLTAFKTVFVSLIMPYSAQRGEQITILATAYNYGDMDIKVHVLLYGNEGFCSIADPRSNKGAKITKTPLPIKAKGSASIPITIVPIKYGLVPVKVLITSNNFMGSDGVERTLLVIPEGIEKLKTQSFILDPQGVLKDSKQNGEKDDNNIKNTTFLWTQIFHKAQNKQIDNIVVGVPKTSIPESVNAMISFTGNLIGPVVTNLITGGLEGLLRMPTGCGEQTMIYMSPNVYVLQYLSNTKQVTASVEAKAYRFIESGYKRELNYRRNDNSFSAWGNTRPGSTWLTAFVAKVFCEASKFDGVQIDENSMCLSIQWLIKNQRVDGAFPEVHHVIHREMVGGVYQNGDIAITAFVVTALLECKCHQVGNTGALSKAVAYLENNLNNMNDAYSIALTTYALAMANSPQRHKANNKLTQLALYDSALVSRHWNAGGHALNIETAAYALLAQLALNRLKYAGPIVTWLTEQKNSGGGFKSTTDTCVALQSLAKYSEHTAGAKLDLKIVIKPSYVPNGLQNSMSIDINNQNALLQQTVDIYPYLRHEGVDFVIETSGTGVAQMQFKVKYNLPATKEEKCAFTIKTSLTNAKTGASFKMNDAPAGRQPHRLSKRAAALNNKHKKKCMEKKKKDFKACKTRPRKKKCRKRARQRYKKCLKNSGNDKKPKTEAPRELTINVCTQYKKKGKTGMAIVDVGVLTGYKADEDSLKKLKTKMNDTFANYEISDRSVVFYLDSIDSAKEVCIGLKIVRLVEMGAVYPVPIKVYDYYEPDDSCTEYYGLGKGATEIGSCNGDKCTCTQDKCAALNPSIKNHDKLVLKICNEYSFAIVAKVIHLDEEDSWLTYHVKVQEVIREGNKNIMKDDVIQFWKRGSCLNPYLSKGQFYFIMGRDKAGKYIIDNSAFVADVAPGSLTAVAQRIQNGECDS